MNPLALVQKGVAKIGTKELATVGQRDLSRKSVGEVGSILGSTENMAPPKMKYAGGNVEDYGAYGKTGSKADDIIDAEWREIPTESPKSNIPPVPPMPHISFAPSASSTSSTSLLEGNKKINDAWGVSAAYKSIMNGLRSHVDRRIMGSQDIRNKLRSGNGSIASSADITDTDRLKSLYYNKDGSYNKTMIGGTLAGGYMGISAAGRIASGGGLYRDSEGNFDVIGIPVV